jgi:uncharacterized membrane protein
MIQLPPIPSWDGLHPLIIHFPIALLLIAPIFVLVGTLLIPARGRTFLITALLMMVLGTAATFAAVSTGKAAGQVAERSPQVNAVLEQHEELAETTRVVFSVLTVLFVAIVFAPQLLQKPPSRLTTTALPLLFLVLYGAGAVLLTNTAHNGGRLVHELGVKAVVAPSPEPPVTMSDERGNSRSIPTSR